MRDPIVIALVGMGLLQLKHFVCDFVLQTSRHVQFKGIYGHPAGLEHSGIHAMGTIPCLWLIGVAPLSAIAIAAGEFVIHYHTDWAKEQINRRAGWTPAVHSFWVAQGVDQLVHHATYLGIMTLILIASPGMLA
jgi:hypothetical protein